MGALVLLFCLMGGGGGAYSPCGGLFVTSVSLFAPYLRKFLRAPLRARPSFLYVDALVFSSGVINKRNWSGTKFENIILQNVTQLHIMWVNIKKGHTKDIFDNNTLTCKTYYTVNKNVLIIAWPA